MRRKTDTLNLCSFFCLFLPYLPKFKPLIQTVKRKAKIFEDLS
jgi:hypothetical protein